MAPPVALERVPGYSGAKGTALKPVNIYHKSNLFFLSASHRLARLMKTFA